MNDTTLYLAQTSPVLGDVKINLERHLTILEDAKKRGAGLCVFPELSLTGYFLNDLTDELAMAANAPAVRQLVDATRGTAALFGFVERAPDHRVYNASAYAENGKLLHIHRKVYLPTYGIFDDGRYFAPGTRFAAFDSAIGRVGILICEDAWHLASSYLLFLQNVDLIVVPSASPGRGQNERGEVSSLRAWEATTEAMSQLFQTYIAYCNRVGVEDGLCFFGGSRVLDPFGTVVAKIDGLDEGSEIVKLDNGALRRARLFAPMRRDEKPDIVLRELERIVKSE
jgi:predicted amidohydrolase